MYLILESSLEHYASKRKQSKMGNEPTVDAHYSSWAQVRDFGGKSVSKSTMNIKVASETVDESALRVYASMAFTRHPEIKRLTINVYLLNGETATRSFVYSGKNK